MRGARANRGDGRASATHGGRGEQRAWVCVGGACILVLGACQKDPVVTTRTVTLHAPQSCAADLSNLDAGAFVVYHALGDYEPAAPSDGHMLTVGKVLPEIDPAARELLVVATEQDRGWQGLSSLAPAGPVDVLLLPATTPCALRSPTAAAVGGAATIGITGSQRVLIVGAPTMPASAAPGAAVLRLDTGAIDALPGASRTGATVTAFGTGALVAGGIAGPSTSGDALATAMVYDPVTGDFPHTIALSGPRSGAGAVVLASGETLLVGGVGKDGAVLDSMEIVDPVTRKARVAGAKLSFPSPAPIVLRLASGEIFVADVVDTGDGPITKLEWFRSDASLPTKTGPQDLVAGSARTYVALEGGGVLAVIAPPAGMPALPAGTPSTFQNTWVIGPDGAREAATPIEGALAQPVLFAGAGGAPVLWTGASLSGVPGRWLRWQPWTGAFVALDVLDDTPSRVMSASASPDPGAALWLDTSAAGAAKLVALRFDVRSEYSTLAGPLLLSDTTDMAPDRLPTDGVSFDSTDGGLTLRSAAGTSSPSAFVTDRTYEDVRIEVDAPTGVPALVVLRDASGDELVVGGGACSGTVVVTTGRSTLTVERKGANVTWVLSGAASGTGMCALGFDASARISIGLRAAPDLMQSIANNLRVTRLGRP